MIEREARQQRAIASYLADRPSIDPRGSRPRADIGPSLEFPLADGAHHERESIFHL